MLVAGLVLLEGLSVLVVAHQRKVIALAPLDGIRDGRAADGEPLVEHARQVSQCLECLDECLPVLCRDLGTELE